MNILDYNQFTETLNCSDMMCDTGMLYDERHEKKRPKKVEIVGSQTRIKEGFNEHSMVLPNGCKITANEAGEVFMQEEGGKPKKLRNKDALQCMLVK